MSRPGIIVDFNALTESGRRITQWAQDAGWAVVVTYISEKDEESVYFFALEWLELHGVAHDMLLIRQPAENGSVSGAKVQLIDEITDSYKIEFVLDPDPVSGLVYRQQGFEVLAEWQDGVE